MHPPVYALGRVVALHIQLLLLGGECDLPPRALRPQALAQRLRRVAVARAVGLAPVVGAIERRAPVDVCEVEGRLMLGLAKHGAPSFPIANNS
jgi:hypothetical protein